MTKEVKIISAIGIITVALFLGAVLLLSSGSKQTVKADEDVLKENNTHKIVASSDKVTIVEFADFQCPACGQAYPQIKKLLDDYKGKINYVYRHFPLPQHLNGELAAKAAEAAGEQNKFWEMSDLLFTRQREWSESTKTDEIFTNYAKDLGLNVDQFHDSLQSDKYLETIKKDKNDGVALGVNSTPTIFINGIKLLLPATYSNMASVVKSKLDE